MPDSNNKETTKLSPAAAAAVAAATPRGASKQTFWIYIDLSAVLILLAIIGIFIYGKNEFDVAEKQQISVLDHQRAEHDKRAAEFQERTEARQKEAAERQYQDRVTREKEQQAARERVREEREKLLDDRLNEQQKREDKLLEDQRLAQDKATDAAVKWKADAARRAATGGAAIEAPEPVIITPPLPSNKPQRTLYVLKDGRRIVAVKAVETGDAVSLKTPTGKFVSIQKADIDRIEPMD